MGSVSSPQGLPYQVHPSTLPTHGMGMRVQARCTERCATMAEAPQGEPRKNQKREGERAGQSNAELACRRGFFPGDKA